MLIPVNEMGTLKSASDVKTIAENATLEQEKISVAQVINLAANTGVMHAFYNSPMSDELIQVLEDEGYKINPVRYPDGSKVPDQYCIVFDD